MQKVKYLCAEEYGICYSSLLINFSHDLDSIPEFLLNLKFLPFLLRFNLFFEF